MQLREMTGGCIRQNADEIIQTKLRIKIPRAATGASLFLFRLFAAMWFAFANDLASPIEIVGVNQDVDAHRSDAHETALVVAADPAGDAFVGEVGRDDAGQDGVGRLEDGDQVVGMHGGLSLVRTVVGAMDEDGAGGCAKDFVGDAASEKPVQAGAPMR